MKICTYCGKEHPDDATVCSLDQQPLESSTPKSLQIGKSEQVKLFSPLTPAECVSKLEAAIDYEGFMLLSFASIFGSKPVIGRVTESSIRLRKRIYYRNSFQNISRQLYLQQIPAPPFRVNLQCTRSYGLLWSSGLVGSSLSAVRCSFVHSLQHFHRQQNSKVHGSGLACSSRYVCIWVFARALWTIPISQRVQIHPGFSA